MAHKIYITLILFLICVLWFTNNRYIDSKDNIIYLTDSISTITNKNGDLISYKQAAEISLKDLKKINEDLYNEVKNLKENPLVVEKIKIEYKYKDTIKTETNLDTIINKDERKYNLYWKHNSIDGSLKIDGMTSISFGDNNVVKNYYTDINNLNIGIELIGVMTKTKKGLTYNIIPKNENIKITNIEGYIINDYNPKPKKFGLSLFGGPTYDFTNKHVGVSVGFGVTYDIMQLF